MAGKLILVGLGIGDETGISLEGLGQLKSCERLFAESYTNVLPEGTLARLEKLVGKGIELLSREQVEGEKVLLDAAASSSVVLAVPGDPMIATTHISLVLAAKKKGIPVRIIHASSILSAAIGESGLQAYKFGKTVTLAYWRSNYRPMAAYEVIAENLSRGLHTLLLLDIDEKLGAMKPQEAARILLEMEKFAMRRILLPETKVAVLSGIGRDGARLSFLSLASLNGGQPSSRPQAPSVLILPGNLHFLEKEFLESLG